MFNRQRSGQRREVLGHSGKSEHPASPENAEDQERHILAALADLRDTTVREVMTPRVDVVGLAIPITASDVARAVRESSHSVFPVFDDDLDHLVGVLYLNDVFRAGWDLEPRGDDRGRSSQQGHRPSPLEISRRVRQAFLVPESRLVLDVLADMRREKRGFAVVVDEYGGVAGVVTLKDLLGAIVGDLRDEFDRSEEPDIIRVDQRRWLVDGGTSVDTVRERLGIDIPDGDYVTLGGFMFDVLGHIPSEGEELSFDGWILQVQEMDRRRIAKVVMTAPSTLVNDPPGG